MADQAMAPASGATGAAPAIAGDVNDFPVSRRQRLAGLLVVLAVAFLPAIASSLSRAYREPLSNLSTAYIQLRYFNSLITELTSLALCAYVIAQNRQKLSDFGFAFRWRDIVYGVLLWAAADGCHSLLYRPILSACALFGWHYAAPYVPKLGLGLLGYIFVFVNPVYEEMIVRAFLITETTALAGSARLAIAFSVLLQTSYHLYQGIPWALMAGVTFLILSIYYVKARQIIPVITAHFIFDLSYLLMQSRLVHS